ncbi:MAG TPA: group II truncated hemoglobin, partial [Polyangiaceae bacterium]|nr:group II truncated hemoglobin [Polyangiaceae bacterium]
VPARESASAGRGPTLWYRSAVAFVPSQSDTPFDRLGGEAGVRALVERFYDAMAELEPALARLHPCDADGRVERASRDRFALFFIGWLGGPQDYVAQHGHPRLRMRHGSVPVDRTMAIAWMRCMRAALEGAGVADEVRAFLEAKLGDVAQFLRNREG